jgi:hypothetical protein
LIFAPANLAAWFDRRLIVRFFEFTQTMAANNERRGIAVATLSPVKKSKAGIDWNLVDQTRERSKAVLRDSKLNARLVVREMRDAGH